MEILIGLLRVFGKYINLGKLLMLLISLFYEWLNIHYSFWIYTAIFKILIDFNVDLMNCKCVISS